MTLRGGGVRGWRLRGGRSPTGRSPARQTRFVCHHRAQTRLGRWGESRCARPPCVRKSRAIAPGLRDIAGRRPRFYPACLPLTGNTGKALRSKTDLKGGDKYFTVKSKFCVEAASREEPIAWEGEGERQGAGDLGFGTDKERCARFSTHICRHKPAL